MTTNANISLGPITINFSVPLPPDDVAARRAIAIATTELWVQLAAASDSVLAGVIQIDRSAGAKK